MLAYELTAREVTALAALVSRELSGLELASIVVSSNTTTSCRHPSEAGTASRVSQ
jgi:hypothetical protein